MFHISQTIGQHCLFDTAFFKKPDFLVEVHHSFKAELQIQSVFSQVGRLALSDMPSQL